MNISCFIPLLFTGVCRRRPLVTFPFSCKVAATQDGRASHCLFAERHHGGSAEGGRRGRPNNKLSMTVLHERPVTAWRAGSHSSESTRCFIGECGTRGGEERDGGPDAARTRCPPVSECPQRAQRELDSLIRDTPPPHPRRTTPSWFRALKTDNLFRGRKTHTHPSVLGSGPAPSRRFCRSSALLAASSTGSRLTQPRKMDDAPSQMMKLEETCGCWSS